MLDQPILESLRFLLRPLDQEDGSAIQSAASAYGIADTMISIPHPYPEGEAERYIARRRLERESGFSAVYTINKKSDGIFSGLVEIRDIDNEHSQGELSFWLAVDAWGQGCMSEVVQTMLPYGFTNLHLNRIYAYSMLRNPASGRVLEKNGFKQEGVLRQRVRKWGVFEDVSLWAILRYEWQENES